MDREKNEWKYGWKDKLMYMETWTERPRLHTDTQRNMDGKKNVWKYAWKDKDLHTDKEKYGWKKYGKTYGSVQ